MCYMYIIQLGYIIHVSCYELYHSFTVLGISGSGDLTHDLRWKALHIFLFVSFFGGCMCVCFRLPWIAIEG